MTVTAGCDRDGDRNDIPASLGTRCGLRDRYSRLLVVGVAEQFGVVEMVLLCEPGFDGRRETDNDRPLSTQPGDVKGGGGGTVVRKTNTGADMLFGGR